MASGNSREWNAADYHRLANPHVAWGKRVLERLPLRGDETVVDAGCGSGRLTRELLDMLPAGNVIAVDQSENMLAEAQHHLAPVAGGRVDYERADLQQLALAAPVDAIFSTAALHWVPDHQQMFNHFYAALKPGGWLVAQCGGGPNIATLLARANRMMQSPAFVGYFQGWNGPWEFASPETTAGRLSAAGFAAIETDLEPAPVLLESATEYRDYLETIVFGSHLERIPEPALRDRFLDSLTTQSSGDEQPFHLDYWRLNIRAQRPEPDE